MGNKFEKTKNTPPQLSRNNIPQRTDEDSDESSDEDYSDEDYDLVFKDDRNHFCHEEKPTEIKTYVSIHDYNSLDEFVEMTKSCCKNVEVLEKWMNEVEKMNMLEDIRIDFIKLNPKMIFLILDMDDCLCQGAEEIEFDSMELFLKFLFDFEKHEKEIKDQFSEIRTKQDLKKFLSPYLLENEELPYNSFMKMKSLLMSKLKGDHSDVLKRRYEKINISKMKNRKKFFELFGVIIPEEIVLNFLDFLPRNVEMANKFTVVCEQFYVIYYSSIKRLEISQSQVMKVPILVWKNVEFVFFKNRGGSIFLKSDYSFIFENTQNLRGIKISNSSISFFKTEKKPFRNLTELRIKNFDCTKFFNQKEFPKLRKLIIKRCRSEIFDDNINNFLKTCSLNYLGIGFFKQNFDKLKNWSIFHFSSILKRFSCNVKCLKKIINEEEASCHIFQNLKVLKIKETTTLKITSEIEDSINILSKLENLETIILKMKENCSDMNSRDRYNEVFYTIEHIICEKVKDFYLKVLKRSVHYFKHLIEIPKLKKIVVNIKATMMNDKYVENSINFVKNFKFLESENGSLENEFKKKISFERKTKIRKLEKPPKFVKSLKSLIEIYRK